MNRISYFVTNSEMSTVADQLKAYCGPNLMDGQASYMDSPKRFRYTLDNPRMTEEQRIFYEHNGFIVFRNLVPHHLLDRWSQYFVDICDGKVDPGRILRMKDVSLLNSGVTGERLYNKIQDFMWDDLLFQYISLPEIVNIVKCFTGNNIMAVHTMLINKPPDAGSESSRHPLHQDLHYFPFRPADKIVCSWTAMETVTRDNGCLVVLPGSHRGDLYPHEYPAWEGGVNKAYHGIVGFDGHNRVHLTMDKGDTVFFHPKLIHGSGANRTKGFRKAISCHYADSDCHYIDVKGTTQDNIAAEVEALAIKKGLPAADYRDIWKYRARLVHGQESKL